MTERKFTHPKDAEEGHKWQTRDGEKFQLYAHDRGGDHPIHGAYFDEASGEWVIDCWTDNGFVVFGGGVNHADLVDAPRMVKVQGYVNVYRGDAPVSDIHSRKELADALLMRLDRVACIKIDMEVEEGRYDD
jgi:hypothetical protein